MKQQRILLKPGIDLMLLGGFSMASVLWLSCYPSTTRLLLAYPEFILALSLTVSYPHIMGSYQLFFGQNGPWRQHKIRAFAVPLLLIAVLFFAILQVDRTLLNGIGQAAFIYFHWHFASQAFGSTLWVSASAGPQKKVGIPILRKELLFATLGLGVVGFLAVQALHATGSIFKLELTPLPIGDDLTKLLPFISGGALMLGVSSVVLIAYSWRLPKAALALIPLVSLYTWFDPRFIGSPIRLLLPTFHALQYMPFYLRTRIVAHQRTGLTPYMMIGKIVLGWLLLCGIGYVCFEALPTLARSAAVSMNAAEPERVAGAIAIFLNVHHYVIDATLWRMKDPLTRLRLGLDAS